MESSPSDVRRHREMLVVCGIVLALAFMLVVRPDQRVAFWFLPSVPLPETCASRTWFGVSCPGCGLTRGLIHLAHADWSAALGVHRLSLLMGAVVLLQFPYRIACLVRGGRPPFGSLWPRLCAHGLIAILIGNWLLDQFL